MIRVIENIFKYTTFFVSGLISGVAIGLLTAPKSGKELRKDLINRSWEVKKVAEDKIEEFEDVSRAQAGKIAYAIRNTADTLSTNLDKLARNNGHHHKERAKTAR